MAKNHNLQKDYLADLMNTVEMSTTGEIAVVLSVEIESDMGFIVLERGINMKEESMFYHRKNANTVYVYSQNRSIPSRHEIGSKVILDSISSINYAHDNGYDQRFIFQKSTSDLIIKGGHYYIDKIHVDLIDLDTETGEFNLTPNTYNYISVDLDLQKYIITTTADTSKYPVAIIDVNASGTIDNIERINAISIGGGMTTEEKLKLQGLNKDDYEKLSNKRQTVRLPANADTTAYPSEKAVALKLDTKVDKINGKALSTNDYTDIHKNTVQGIIDDGPIDLTPFEIKDNKVEGIRNSILSDHESYPTEKAVRIELDTKVNKISGKALSKNDYTDIYKQALDNLISLNLGDIDFSKTPVIAGRGIDVDDLGAAGWRVNNTSHSNVGLTGEHIDVNPVNEYTAVKFIDEQKYVVLEDSYRNGVYGNSKFKNGANPNVTVFYHNPNGAGKMLIDTHIRIVDGNGSMNEVHKSVPYTVDVVAGHGAFMLSQSSFTGLDYSDSSVMYIKVHRVGAYVTDVNGSEFNSNIDDLDTVVGEIRVKSMFLDYNQTLILQDPDYAYKHTQSYESDTWLVHHELGTKAIIIQCYDADKIPIEEDTYSFVDYENLEIKFTAPVAGTVVLLAAGGVSTEMKDKNFEQEFTAVTGGGTYIHNLGKYASVIVINNSGEEVQTEVTHIDKNTISITWIGTHTGVIIAN